MISSMATLEMVKMKSNVPAKLHKVEPVMMPNLNGIIILIGAVAIMVMVALLFNFMMDDFNLLLVKSI